MDLTEYFIFRAAHDGDNGPLVDLLKSGAEVTPERRGLIIKILSGEIEHPPHRQKRVSTSRQKGAIAKRVRELEGEMKQMAAIAQVAAEYKCSEKKVKIALKEEQERDRKDAEFYERLNRLADHARKPSSRDERLRLFDLAVALNRLRNKRMEDVGLKKVWRRPFLWEEIKSD